MEVLDKNVFFKFIRFASHEWFHGSVFEYSVILEHAVITGNWFPILQRNIMSSSLRIESLGASTTLKMKAHSYGQE